MNSLTRHGSRSCCDPSLYNLMHTAQRGQYHVDATTFRYQSCACFVLVQTACYRQPPYPACFRAAKVTRQGNTRPRAWPFTQSAFDQSSPSFQLATNCLVHICRSVSSTMCRVEGPDPMPTVICKRSHPLHDERCF